MQHATRATRDRTTRPRRCAAHVCAAAGGDLEAERKQHAASSALAAADAEAAKTARLAADARARDSLAEEVKRRKAAEETAAAEIGELRKEQETLMAALMQHTMQIERLDQEAPLTRRVACRVTHNACHLRMRRRTA